MSIPSVTNKTVIFPIYNPAPSTIYDTDIPDIDCERELFPLNRSTLSNRISSANTISRNPTVQSAVNSDSESYRSSLNSSRSSTPDLSECRNPDAVLKIIKQWKKYGPGSEKTVLVGNHEYSVNLERIGSGSFKQVHSAFSETDHAIAVIYANTSTEKNKQFTKNELNALQLCETQNISGTPRLLDKSYQIGRDWKRFATTFCEEGTIDQWADGKKLSDKLNILFGVATTLEEMHQLGFAHCDIKSENIGIHDGKSIVLDFGLFTKNGHESSSQGITMAYLPPRDKPSTAIQSDVFSFGVTLYEIIQENVTCGALCKAVMHEKGWDSPFVYFCNTTQADIDGAIKQLDTPEELKTLLRSLLKVNPEERISSAQARKELEKLL